MRKRAIVKKRSSIISTTKKFAEKKPVNLNGKKDEIPNLLKNLPFRINYY